MAQCSVCGAKLSRIYGFYTVTETNGFKWFFCRNCNQRAASEGKKIKWNYEKNMAEFVEGKKYDLNNLNLEKDVDDIKQFLLASSGKTLNSTEVSQLNGVLDSMDEDETIIYAFKGSVFEITSGGRHNSIAEYTAIISSKRFYCIGQNGQSSMFISSPKSSTIDLVDVHAISFGVESLLKIPFVTFEAKNDDYKISVPLQDPQIIKNKLEEAVKKAKSSSQNQGNIIQQSALSPADEIKKYKELLDSGIITQEEFDAKKKQLLGL